MNKQYQGTHLRNRDLRAVYKYIKGEITQAELARRLNRQRTNTYYYIGRALHYWVASGILRWKDGIKGMADLGGEKPRPKRKQEQK